MGPPLRGPTVIAGLLAEQPQLENVRRIETCDAEKGAGRRDCGTRREQTDELGSQDLEASRGRFPLDGSDDLVQR